MKLTQEDKGRQVVVRFKNGTEMKGDVVIVREDFFEIVVGDGVALPHVNRNDLRRIKYAEIEKLELSAK
jgi:mannitol/fructose-specific phosphotransferase system IIA component (Ntr-type)